MENPVKETVTVDQIESKLLSIWDSLAKDKKTRARLFNLIVYTKLNDRIDYFRESVQKIIENYPCRILFVTSDPDSTKEYLTASVSVITLPGNPHIACDYIEIGVAGKDYERVPFVILPHIVPDLPVYLLWTEDPCLKNPLFESFEKLSRRVLFDSESSDNIFNFGDVVLEYWSKKRAHVADLNWARTETYRDVLAASFHSEDRLKSLQNTEHIAITYNTSESKYFCHLKIQALYLQGWLASRLGWQWVETQQKDEKIEIHYKNALIELLHEDQKEMFPGSILKISIADKDKNTYDFIVDEKYLRTTVRICSFEKCEMPLKFMHGKETRGRSLSKELTYKGSSQHYIETLQLLQKMKDKNLC